mmetsp:Transcript_12717/g.38160  ORF Transcript_12717/g.38160 Transcript_12717/m.38160 type:complete len:303 (+) Transcript_12717:378-1286(+)
MSRESSRMLPASLSSSQSSQSEPSSVSTSSSGSPSSTSPETARAFSSPTSTATVPPGSLPAFTRRSVVSDPTKSHTRRPSTSHTPMTSSQLSAASAKAFSGHFFRRSTQAMQLVFDAGVFSPMAWTHQNTVRGLMVSTKPTMRPTQVMMAFRALRWSDAGTGHRDSDASQRQSTSRTIPTARSAAAGACARDSDRCRQKSGSAGTTDTANSASFCSSSRAWLRWSFVIPGMSFDDIGDSSSKPEAVDFIIGGERCFGRRRFAAPGGASFASATVSGPSLSFASLWAARAGSIRAISASRSSL